MAKEGARIPSWLQEHIEATDKVPPGNEAGNTTWQNKAPHKKSDQRLNPRRHDQGSIDLMEKAVNDNRGVAHKKSDQGLKPRHHGQGSVDIMEKAVNDNARVAFIKGSRGAPLRGFSQQVVENLESPGIDFESVDVRDEE